MSDSTLSANVYIRPNGSETFIDVEPGADVLLGTISISDIIKSLIWHGILPGNYYLSGIQLGPEIGSGSGSLTINNLSYTWDTNPTIVLPNVSNMYDVLSPGGNHIQGNGGVDTVVYSGPYSQFQITSSGSELLVIENGNISTLDVLDGITYIEFSDGIYDRNTSIFTSGVPTLGSILKLTCEW